MNSPSDSVDFYAGNSSSKSGDQLSEADKKTFTQPKEKVEVTYLPGQLYYDKW